MKKPDPHEFERSEHEPDRCAHCGNRRNATWHDTFRYRFPEGTRVRVKPSLLKPVEVDGEQRRRVPEWATKGTVTNNPGPNSDYYGHPRVRWDSDGKQRHVSVQWLEPLNDRNYRKAVCSCGRVIRVSPTTLLRDPIICGACNTEFKTE